MTKTNRNDQRLELRKHLMKALPELGLKILGLSVICGGVIYFSHQEKIREAQSAVYRAELINKVQVSADVNYDRIVDDTELIELGNRLGLVGEYVQTTRELEEEIYRMPNEDLERVVSE